MTASERNLNFAGGLQHWLLLESALVRSDNFINSLIFFRATFIIQNNYFRVFSCWEFSLLLKNCPESSHTVSPSWKRGVITALTNSCYSDSEIVSPRGLVKPKYSSSWKRFVWALVSEVSGSWARAMVAGQTGKMNVRSITPILLVQSVWLNL
jgi:hypothetical protein